MKRISDENATRRESEASAYIEPTNEAENSEDPTDSPCAQPTSIEVEVITPTDTHAENETALTLDIPIVEMYQCAICQKPVAVSSVAETLLSKTYHLECGHYANVSFGGNSYANEVAKGASSKDPKLAPIAPTDTRLEVAPDSRWQQFMDYQKEGIQFLADSGFRGLLADEMGLGKTIQAIGALRYFPEQTLPALIVVPGSVSVKWQRELKKWFNDKFGTSEYAPFIHKESSGYLIEDQKLYIVSNSILGKTGLKKAILEYGFKTIIVDESHQFKNPKSKRTKALFEICEAIPQVILMSGTSVINRVMEYFNTLHLLRPNRWYEKKQLASLCTTDMKGRPLALSETARYRFFAETKKYILRRTKSEVLKDLPAKFVVEEWVNFSDSAKLVAAYNNKLADLEDFFANVSENGLNEAQSATLFGIIAELRHLVGTAKCVRAIEYAANMVATSGEKLCIGVHHRMGLTLLADALTYKRCPECRNFVFDALDDEETTSNGLRSCPTCSHDLSAIAARKPLCISDEAPHIKQSRIDQFRDDADNPLMILSILGGGVGIDLQFVPNVLVVEREWNRAIENQFEDRFHRFGMKQQVTIAYMKAEDTIDEFFDELVKLKAEVSGSTLDENVSTSPQFMYALAQRALQKRLKYAKG
jgi:hypothetical protein